MTQAALEALMAEFSLPTGLVWAVEPAAEDPRALFDAEKAAIARARPPRRAEFTGGRKAARRALSRLGIAPQPIPTRPNRLPHWPDGVVGSITHAGGLCLAVLARTENAAAIGVDLEIDQPLDQGLLPEICLPGDLSPWGKPEHTAMAARVFSAKEALFKAQFPDNGILFGFHGLTLTWERDLQGGVAQFTDHPEVQGIPAQQRARHLPFEQRVGQGLILSLSLWDPMGR